MSKIKEANSNIVLNQAQDKNVRMKYGEKIFLRMYIEQ